jgi:glycosyltransferase involved in cell wall biosynthesis
VEAAKKAREWGVKTVLVGEANPKIFGRLGYAAQSAVVVAGRVSDAELKALYRHAVALIFPSRYEGFGIPLLEAMLCGCPIIASDMPSSREVAGGIAQFVPVGDLNALVDAMERSMQAPDTGPRVPIDTGDFGWAKTASILLSAVDKL